MFEHYILPFLCTFDIYFGVKSILPFIHYPVLFLFLRTYIFANKYSLRRSSPVVNMPLCMFAGPTSPQIEWTFRWWQRSHKIQELVKRGSLLALLLSSPSSSPSSSPPPSSSSPSSPSSSSSPSAPPRAALPAGGAEPQRPPVAAPRRAAQPRLQPRSGDGGEGVGGGTRTHTHTRRRGHPLISTPCRVSPHF